MQFLIGGQITLVVPGAHPPVDNQQHTETSSSVGCVSQTGHRTAEDGVAPQHIRLTGCYPKSGSIFSSQFLAFFGRLLAISALLLTGGI